MIFVDDMRYPHGRMKMSHLIADTPVELRTIANQLGLSQHIQYEGTAKEHLDVSMSKRREAIALGALPVRGRKIVEIVRRKRLELREWEATNAIKTA